MVTRVESERQIAVPCFAGTGAKELAMTDSVFAMSEATWQSAFLKVFVGQVIVLEEYAQFNLTSEI